MSSVSQLRRPADRQESRPAQRIAANMPTRSSVPTQRVQVDRGAILHLLHLVALMALPLALYLAYVNGGDYLYSGLLALVIISNLLILARIDAAQARDMQEQLQSFHTNNQTNHE
jgi:hypothetical protein